MVILLPLLSFIGISLFGRKIGTIGSMLISSINMIIVFIFSFFLILNASDHVYYIEYGAWLHIITGFTVPWSIRYDTLTGVMFVVVTFVSALTHVYSCVYMYTDPYLSRFMAYLSLFSFFMLKLVAAGNFLVLFFGW